MCWGVLSTTIFSGIFIFLILIYWITKPKNWKAYILFNSFYLIMELFQLLQWNIGDVTDLMGTSTNCTIRNRYFTYFAFILIWLQPIMFSFIGWFTYKRYIYIKLLILYIVIFLFGFICVLFVTENNLSYGYNVSMTSLSDVTCTFLGYNGKLAWNFKGFLYDLQVNNLLYLILCIFPFFLYEKELSSISVGWVSTLAICLIFFKVSPPEIASFWCLLSVFGNPIGMIYTYLFLNDDREDEMILKN